MVGIFGTTTTNTTANLVGTDRQKPWYEMARYEGRESAIALVHHGKKDPSGHSFWRDKNTVCVVHGVISNQEQLGLADTELFEKLKNHPESVLPQLSGPFLIAILDERNDSVLVATDKLATRPCYYGETNDGLTFSSTLEAVYSKVPEPRLDVQAVADMISFGNVLGEKTLLKNAQSLPPATMLQYQDGELSTKRYWRPAFGRRSPSGYVRQAAANYQQILSNISDSIEGEVGLWLSGGLDSRTMAAVLRDVHGSFQTFTYDHNPPDGSNIDPARETANYLGVENEFVEIEPGAFKERIETGVEITDGMSSWVYFINPEFILNGLSDRVDIVLEAAPQGELFGEHIWRYHLDRSKSATEAITKLLMHYRVSPERVMAVINADIDPTRTIRQETVKSDEFDTVHRTMDVWFRNFCSNTHFRSKKLTRSQVGTRIPFADGTFIDHLAKMPHDRFRRATFPLTGGKIPRSMAPLKRELICEIDSTLSEIPYERTGLAPSKPLILHDAGYVSKKLKEQVWSPPTPWADWTRNHPQVSEAMNGWLDSACDREAFNGDMVQRLQNEHNKGEANHLQLLAAITTLELWMEEHPATMSDPRRREKSTRKQLIQG